MLRDGTARAFRVGSAEPPLPRSPPRKRNGLRTSHKHGGALKELLRQMWLQDEGEDIAEYAVMLAVILVIVVGTVRLIGSQANNVFSETASAIGS